MYRGSLAIFLFGTVGEDEPGFDRIDSGTKCLPFSERPPQQGVKVGWQDGKLDRITPMKRPMQLRHTIAGNLVHACQQIVQNRVPIVAVLCRSVPY